MVDNTTPTKLNEEDQFLLDNNLQATDTPPFKATVTEEDQFLLDNNLQATDTPPFEVQPGGQDLLDFSPVNPDVKIPSMTERLSINLGKISNIVTGADRETAITRTSPEIGEFTTGSILDDISLAAQTILTTDGLGKANILLKFDKDGIISEDEKGNVLFKPSKGPDAGKIFVLNKPGISQQDINTLLLDLVGFGKAAGLKSATTLGRAVKVGAASGAIDASQQLGAKIAGSQEEYDAVRTAIVASGGALGVYAEPAFAAMGNKVKDIIKRVVPERAAKAPVVKMSIEEKQGLIDVAQQEGVPLLRTNIQEPGAIGEQIRAISENLRFGTSNVVKKQQLQLNDLSTKLQSGAFSDADMVTLKGLQQEVEDSIAANTAKILATEREVLPDNVVELTPGRIVQTDKTVELLDEIAKINPTEFKAIASEINQVRHAARSPESVSNINKAIDDGTQMINDSTKDVLTEVSKNPTLKTLGKELEPILSTPNQSRDTILKAKVLIDNKVEFLTNPIRKVGEQARKANNLLDERAKIIRGLEEKIKGKTVDFDPKKVGLNEAVDDIDGKLVELQYKVNKKKGSLPDELNKLIKDVKSKIKEARDIGRKGIGTGPKELGKFNAPMEQTVKDLKKLAKTKSGKEKKEILKTIEVLSGRLERALPPDVLARAAVTDVKTAIDDVLLGRATGMGPSETDAIQQAVQIAVRALIVEGKVNLNMATKAGRANLANVIKKKVSESPLTDTVKKAVLAKLRPTIKRLSADRKVISPTEGRDIAIQLTKVKNNLEGEFRKALNLEQELQAVNKATGSISLTEKRVVSELKKLSNKLGQTAKEADKIAGIAVDIVDEQAKNLPQIARFADLESEKGPVIREFANRIIRNIDETFKTNGDKFEGASTLTTLRNKLKNKIEISRKSEIVSKGKNRRFTGPEFKIEEEILNLNRFLKQITGKVENVTPGPAGPKSLSGTIDIEVRPDKISELFLRDLDDWTKIINKANKDTKIKQGVDTDKSTARLAKITSNSVKETLKKVTSGLNPKQKTILRKYVFAQWVKKQGNLIGKGDDILKILDTPASILFNAKNKIELKGLAKLLNIMNRPPVGRVGEFVKKINEIPVLSSLAFGAGIFGGGTGLGGSLAAAGTIGVFAKIIESPALVKVLIKLGKTKTPKATEKAASMLLPDLIKALKKLPAPIAPSVAPEAVDVSKALLGIDEVNNDR